MRAAPILIPCEGSGSAGHEHHVSLVAVGVVASSWMCPMCGAMLSVSPIPEHDRQDVLAMIERGDFG